MRAAGVAPEVSPVRRGRFQLSTNPRLVFEPVPGLTLERGGGDHGEVAGPAGVPLYYEYPGSANRLGYRDRNHPLAKPPGTTRIVVLGDSVAAGWGLPDHGDVFPARLERALDRPERPVEVLNFAVTGYNTSQEVETLAARALPYGPDLVLLAYCLNDRRPPDPRLVEALREVAEERAAAGETAVAPGEMDRGVHRLLLASALYRLVRFRLVDPEPPAPEELEEAPRTGPDGEPISGVPGVEAALERLAGLASEHDFRVLVVIFPHQRRPYHYAEHHLQVRRLAEGLGFGVLDLTAAFRACREAGDEELAFDRYHPTAAGHRCAARAIAAHLEQRGWVGGGV